MKFIATQLPEVILIEPVVYKDTRGFFLECYHQRKFADGGIPAPFVQDNHSRSTKSVLRGLHFQITRPQGKLIRVIKGEIFDVAVDIRVGSPRFKEWVGMVLSDEYFQMLYVPPGFAHGFLVLSEAAEVEYKCTDFYNPSDESGIVWNDPEIAVKWPVAAPLLSERDKNAPRLKDVLSLLPKYQVTQ